MELLDISPSWTDRAICKGQVDLFFAPAGEQPAQRVRRETLARAMCAECPVTVECRTWAREMREAGFWGGESEEDRALAGHAPKASVRRSVLRAARAGAAGRPDAAEHEDLADAS